MSVAEKLAARSARKAKGRGHLRRAEILEAAERIFIDHGYEGATIRKIADEVGVSSTALYVHFRDKSEIVAEICSTTFAQLLAINTEIAEQRLEPLEKIGRMLDAHMDFALQHPNAYRLVYGPPPPGLSHDQRNCMSDVGAQAYGPFHAAIEEAAKAGQLKCGDALKAAHIFWAASHGLVELMISWPMVNGEDVKTLKKLMIDSLFYGAVRT